MDSESYQQNMAALVPCTWATIADRADMLSIAYLQALDLLSRRSAAHVAECAQVEIAVSLLPLRLATSACCLLPACLRAR